MRTVAFARLLRRRPVFSHPGSAPVELDERHHFNAIDRTGRHAQFAARTVLQQHRVHSPWRSDDGIDRACLDA
jgi:hypothetical protein